MCDLRIAVKYMACDAWLSSPYQGLCPSACGSHRFQASFHQPPTESLWIYPAKNSFGIDPHLFHRLSVPPNNREWVEVRIDKSTAVGFGYTSLSYLIDSK